jgi:hypothetical protein
VPGEIVILSELPVNVTTSKIDKKALVEHLTGV